MARVSGLAKYEFRVSLLPQLRYALRGPLFFGGWKDQKGRRGDGGRKVAHIAVMSLPGIVVAEVGRWVWRK